MNGVPARPSVPGPVLDRVSGICLSLPETSLRSDAWAHAFQVRRRAFASLLATDDGAEATAVLLVVDADPHERRALLATGHPYFPAASNERRLGIVLDEETDWTEVTELVTESYRLLAPKKLSKLVDDAGLG